MNCIAPGIIYFKGGLWDKKLKKKNKYFRRYINTEVPEKRLGLQMKIANLVGYLCSEKSSFINGAVIGIDGASKIKFIIFLNFIFMMNKNILISGAGGYLGSNICYLFQD